MTAMHTAGDLVRDKLRSLSKQMTNCTGDHLSENFAHQDAYFHYATEKFGRACHSAGMSEVMTAQAIERGREAMNKANSATESPIEKLLLPWLIFQDYGQFMTYPARVHLPKEEHALPTTGIVIVPQFAFVRFRLDFAVVARHQGHSKIIAVECDGEDFHNAARDDYRDRYLSSWGIETIRASGRLIHSDPHTVSERVARVALNWYGDLMGIPH